MNPCDERLSWGYTILAVLIVGVEVGRWVERWRSPAARQARAAERLRGR